jgi:hypothetical protein
MAPEGYAKIASTMSHHSELAIFRRFSKLNLQNLLYLQAELTLLEKDLDELVERDKTNPNRGFYTKDWWSLAESSDDEEGQEQWDKVLQIREKLKEYSTTSISFFCRMSPDFPLAQVKPPILIIFLPDSWFADGIFHSR